MKDIRDINDETQDVFHVAMAPSFYIENTFFIFRTSREQIEITVFKNSFVSTSILYPDELKHIKKYYPLLDTVTYKVRSK